MSCYHPHFSDNVSGKPMTHCWSSQGHWGDPGLIPVLQKGISDLSCLACLIGSVWNSRSAGITSSTADRKGITQEKQNRMWHMVSFIRGSRVSEPVIRGCPDHKAPEMISEPRWQWKGFSYQVCLQEGGRGQTFSRWSRDSWDHSIRYKRWH